MAYIVGISDVVVANCLNADTLSTCEHMFMDQKSKKKSIPLPMCVVYSLFQL